MFHEADDATRCTFTRAALDELLQNRQFESIDIGFDQCCWDHTSRITSSGRIYLTLREMSTLRSFVLLQGVFDSTNTLCDSLPSQLKVLRLDYLSRERGEDLTRDDCHALARTLAGLRHLVQLSLAHCQLTDEDVGILMQEKRVNLRKLNLEGAFGSHQQGSYLTDHALHTISAACPYLQAIELSYQRRLTAQVVAEFMKASPHLREASFADIHIPLNVVGETLTHPSTSKLVLLCFGSFHQQIDMAGLSRLIATTGGRIVFTHPLKGLIQPVGVNETVRAAYDSSKRMIELAGDRAADPSVHNEWNDYF